jgi:hypothetical protein
MSLTIHLSPTGKKESGGQLNEHWPPVVVEPAELVTAPESGGQLNEHWSPRIASSAWR